MIKSYTLVPNLTAKACTLCGGLIYTGHPMYCPDCGRKLLVCDECLSFGDPCRCGGELISTANNIPTPDQKSAQDFDLSIMDEFFSHCSYDDF